MLKRLLFLILIIFSGCSNPPAPKEKAVTTSHVRKPSTIKPAANLWKISSFAPREAGKEGRRFVRFVTDGNFSDDTRTNSYLYAEVLVDKTTGGIFLHELERSGPIEKFSGPVQIKMTNSSGEELLMTSSRSWNGSGGILIEKNNNDYSRFRIFLLQCTGIVTVEIRDSGSKIYNFNIDTNGLNDSFSKL